MTSDTIPKFWKLYRRLPRAVRVKALAAYATWLADPFDPRLQFKELNGKPGTWSVRLGGGYRAAGIRRGDEMSWDFIGTHPEYELYCKLR